MKKTFIALLLIAISAQLAFTQDLLSPTDFFGYAPGGKFTPHHRLEDYLHHLADNSKKVKMEQYGVTNEGRALYLMFITSEKNQRKLEQIRQNNLKAAGFLEGETEGKQLPIVWLSYNIHGNESAGTEAAISTLYSLLSGNNLPKAKGETPDVEKWLEEMVIVIDPCENPDGRDRYVNWYKQTKGPNYNTDANAWEHNEAWPGGRFNHYLFDLNRDWAWQTQVETQGKVKNYQEWMPHVHVDLHEMGMNSPYFFGPAAKPMHEVITKWQKEFHQISGEHNSKYFDSNGWLYFTREVFDLYYPSYGDTWPMYNGAIGFTYEQGGSGRGGLGVMPSSGVELTLKSRLEHHKTSSFGTIEAAFEQREKLLENFNNYFSEAQTSPVSPYKSYVVKGSNDPIKLKTLAELLDKQQIKYAFHTGTRGKSISGFSYDEKATKSVSIEEGDLVVSAYQPQSRMVQVLFEPEGKLEDSLTYDLTAWALPYVYGVEAYAFKDKITASGKSSYSFTPNQVPNEYNYAFVAEWKNTRDVKFLASLLKNGLKVRYSEEGFTLSGKKFDKGTLVVNIADNPMNSGEFNKLVVDLANELEVPVTATETGFVTEGKDFGSSSMKLMQRPNVAIVNGDGISPTAFGELWFFFEEELEFPVTILNSSNLSYTDLSSYDVLILPSGRVNSAKSKILDFADNGGKVIALERAISMFASAESTSLGEAVDNAKDKKKKNGKETELKRFDDRQRSGITNSVEGSVYKVYLDDSHPLSFGEDNSFYVIKRNRSTYPYLESGWNVGVFKDDSHVSGFTGAGMKEKAKNTLAIGEESYGNGTIIYMTDSPIIRGFWESGKILLGNAVFLVGN
ncbi:M14 family metallopeptidase [Flammeovirgaceae bacterium SG7u.111]|nr:M14 family metallopeptidase [Flammeovirgaceae bacterium SG7u.132]WPO35607.1 M14 family metallopeptidase [Flammeovirgaceae bacterium SG7u.111]